MPLYEYKCQNCGKKFEELINSGQGEAIHCPHCSSNEVQRMLSTFGCGTKNGSETASDSSCSLCSSGSCSTCGF
ncbi:MAG: zinc ribbon domain-containing protein [Candidatus Latescibacteria bacterium]|nr:zinc ribbon domain-containing protein [Candidatus Latescibacterota bacterium]